MNTKLTLAAAVLFAATAAFAQVSPGPAQSADQPRDSAGMSPPTTTSPNGNLSGGTYDANQPGNTHGTSSEPTADGMKKVDGKWTMGDRPATKAEIAEHKRMSKAEKPM